MLKIIAATTLALSFAACSKDGGGGLAALKKEACACKTADCAKAVDTKMDKYMDGMTSIPTSADMAAVGEAAACLAPLLSSK